MSTKISWCDEVWNPVVGCSRVSKGCAKCYAFALHDRRYAANKKEAKIWHGPRPYAMEARKRGVTLPFPAQYDKPFGAVQLLPERLDQPLRWRKPRRIFVCSMADLFHDDVPDIFIRRVWETMARASQHTFLVLTKRPERMRTVLEKLRWQYRSEGEWYDSHRTDGLPLVWPLSNVHLGVSVENQAMADARISELLKIPAAVRWLSYEPGLGPLDLRAYLGSPLRLHGQASRLEGMQYPLAEPYVGWVVCGGESGPGRREMKLDWARSLKAQCDAAGVAFYFKQGSGSRPGMPCGDPELDSAKELV